jgi:SWI/SNF-related matrix-associated actin-dependent regulator 1 of chromatin subfamily A
MELLAGFNPVKIDGRTPDATRENAVRSFQSAPHVRVFVGQLHSASTAITLTASRNVLMAEADWTPGINDQAIRRAYRIGQRNAVNARFVALEGTMDAQIMKTLARKTADNAALMDAHQSIQAAI